MKKTHLQILSIILLVITIVFVVFRRPSNKPVQVKIFKQTKSIGRLSDSIFFSYTFDMMQKDGNLFLIDYQNFSILKLDRQFNLIKRIGHKGHGPGEFVSPFSLAIDTDTLYVYDNGKNALILFTLDGKFLTEKPFPQEPGQIFVNFDLINNVVVYSPKNQDPHRLVILNLADTKYHSFLKREEFKLLHETYGRNFWFTRFLNNHMDYIIAVGKSIPKIILFKRVKDMQYEPSCTVSLETIPRIKKQMERIDAIYKKRKPKIGFITVSLTQDMDIFNNDLYILPYAPDHNNNIIYQYNIIPPDQIKLQNEIHLANGDSSISILNFAVLDANTIAGVSTKNQICLFELKGTDK